MYSNEPACTNSASGQYSCSTDNYGIAWAEVIGSPNAGVTSSITATAGGISADFGAQEGCGPSVISAPAITGVAEAATGATTVAPGSYISIYGSNLVNSAFVAGAVGDSATYVPLPLTIDGVNVSFDVPNSYDGTPLHYNGSPGYLTFVATSGGQVNLQIPWELQGAGSVQVKVTVDGYANSNVFTVPLTQYAPQLFQGNGIVAAVNATTGKIVTASTPAKAGDVVELFGNGLGPVSNTPDSGGPAPGGPLAQTTTPATVTVGGKSAAVGFAGLAPGFPGLYQINITVPSGAGTGNQPVVLSIGGASSKTAQIPLQ